LHVGDSFDEAELEDLFACLDNAIDTKSYGNILLYFNYFKNSMTQLPASVPLLQFSKKTFETFLEDIGISYDVTHDISTKDILVEPNAYEFLQEAHRQIRHYMIASALLQNKA
jgi:F0F1-type ATP synthase gamma subunit